MILNLYGASGSRRLRGEEKQVLASKDLDTARGRAAEILARAGIALTRAEIELIEIADFGLSRLEQVGLEVVVYVNTERVCAKELVMFPWQLCPEHKHPPFEGTPGKEETFRCRTGKVYLYTEGQPTPDPSAQVPKDAVLNVWHEIVLRPGDQYTIEPNTRHWFQAGDEGAIVSEFSTQSRDELDIFSDPRIQRSTLVGEV
jgi:D-lyxose ketol-isomerase